MALRFHDIGSIIENIEKSILTDKCIGLLPQ